MKASLLLMIVIVVHVNGQIYNDTIKLFKELFNKDVYNPQVVPVYNQTQPIYVEVYFYLISIESVDDAKQSFVCNGFFTLYWIDERLQWDPELYGGLYLIHPLPKQMWRPRMVLLNTLNDRDLFGDDVSPTAVLYNGTATWGPGTLFTTSCSLSLLKYPFDEQHCSIKMLSMGLGMHELIFVSGYENVSLDFYSANGEWDLLEAELISSVSDLDFVELSTFEVQLRVKRRSTFYLLNIILPFVFLSFLNLLIFIIPQDSGEKISYGITVLLALAVYLSIIGEMLPRSSNIVPNIIIYLSVLFIISVLSVVDTIFIVYLYYVEEKGEHYRGLFGKVHKVMRAVTKAKRSVSALIKSAKVSTGKFSRRNSSVDKVKFGKSEKDSMNDILEVLELDQLREMRSAEDQRGKGKSDPVEIDYRCTAALVDFYSFFVFVLGWTVTTMWFFISVIN